MSHLYKEYLNRGIFAEAMVEKYFDPDSTKIVSDVGAGFGHMRKKIEEVGGIWQPFDYVRKIDNAILWDLNNPVPKEAKRAEMVVFLEVLEHLANPLLALQNLAGHMLPGGTLILTTPNPQSSKNRLNLLLKGTLYAFQKKHLTEHHVFTPWEHIVCFYLEQIGFEILEYVIVDTAYTCQKHKTIKAKIKRLVERFIEKKSPKAKGMSYGMVARKL